MEGGERRPENEGWSVGSYPSSESAKYLARAVAKRRLGTSITTNKSGAPKPVGQGVRGIMRQDAVNIKIIMGIGLSS